MATTTAPATPATPTTQTGSNVPTGVWIMMVIGAALLILGIGAWIYSSVSFSVPASRMPHPTAETPGYTGTEGSTSYVPSPQPPINVTVNNNMPAPVAPTPAEEEEVEVEEKPAVAKEDPSPVPVVAAPVVEDLGLKCSLFFTITDGQFGYPTKAEVKGLDGDNWETIIGGPIVVNKAGVGQVLLNGPASTLRRGGFRCKDVGMLLVYLNFNDLPENQRDSPDFVSFEVDDENGNSEAYSTLRVDKDKQNDTYAFLVRASGTTKEGVYHR